MNGESLLMFLLIGALAGWLSGMIIKGHGLGLIGDIVVGVIGSFIGGWLFNNFHLVHGSGFLGELVGATVGAMLLLLVVRLVRGRRRAW